MMGWISAFIFLPLTLLGSVAINVPKGWDCINDPSQLPKKIEVIFVGGNSGQFRPTINVAKEPIEVSLMDYVKAAKIYHEKTPQTICQQLGTIKIGAGEGQVLQIDRVTGWGEVRFLQAAIVVDDTAYVITGTCLKKDFGAHMGVFLDAIKSFRIVSS